MELADLLSNPDYVNANTATRKAIFEQVSKKSKDYTTANDETRQAIRQGLGLGGVAITEPLPEKITDFSGRDFGNMVSQSFSEANKQLAKGGRTGVVGPAVLGAVGETIKGIGAIGELATDKAQGITKVGQAITQGAQEANMPAAMVGQVGSYIAPYKLAQKGIQATAGAVPYLRGAVNPNTIIGTTGETAAATGLLAGLTTPGSYDERMKEAQLQALIGGGLNAGIRTGIGAYQTGKGLYQGGRNAIDQQFGTPGARSAFTEVGDNIYPSSAADPFVKLSLAERADPARLAALEASQVPTPSLFQTYPQKFAYNLAETGPGGGKLIPNQGASLAEAFGEQSMRNFQKPITDLSGIGGNLAGAVGGALAGSAFAPGVGTLLGAGAGFVAPQIKRGLELIKLSQLRGAANLNPEFASALKQAQATAASTPQTMAAAQINPAAAQTPAAQAALATTAAKLQQTTGAAVPQRPVGQNVNIPQESLAIKPAPEASIQKMASVVGNDPAVLQSASLEEHAKALYNHYKSVGAPIDKATAKKVAKQEMAAYNKAQSDATAVQQQAAVDAKRAADQAAYDASPIGQSVKAVNQQLANNPNLLTDSKIAVATPQNIERVKRAIEPHENTPVIKQTLKEKVATNPNLTGFDQPYVIPQAVKQPIETFLQSTFGNSKNLVAVGEGGTGKSSLALQWAKENKDGQLNKITKLSFDADELAHQLKVNNNVAKQLYLIDEVDQFSTAQLNQLESLINGKPGAKFLFTTNKPENIPKFIDQYPTVSLNIKLNPEERSAFALNIAEKYNVNKTPAEIEKIAQDPKLTNFADIKKEVSKGYTLKETPDKTFVRAPDAANRMPDTPKTITDDLDALANNELPRNAIIFDRSAVQKDPDLLDKLRRYTGPAIDTDVASLRNLSNRMIGANTVSHESPKLVVVSENNVERLQYLKAELEISNDKTNPLNIVFYDPKNLLLKPLPGESTTPMARRAHIIDESYWQNGPKSQAKALPNEGQMLREQWGTPQEFIKYMKSSLPENEMDRLMKLAFPEYNPGKTKAKASPEDSSFNSLFGTPLETPKPAAMPTPTPAAAPKPEFTSPAQMRRELFRTMPEAELEALIKKTFPK